MPEKTDGARAPSTNDITDLIEHAIDTAAALTHGQDEDVGADFLQVVFLAQILVELREIKTFVKAGSIAQIFELGKRFAGAGVGETSGEPSDADVVDDTTAGAVFRRACPVCHRDRHCLCRPLNDERDSLAYDKVHRGRLPPAQRTGFEQDERHSFARIFVSRVGEIHDLPCPTCSAGAGIACNTDGAPDVDGSAYAYVHRSRFRAWEKAVSP